MPNSVRKSLRSRSKSIGSMKGVLESVVSNNIGDRCLSPEGFSLDLLPSDDFDQLCLAGLLSSSKDSKKELKTSGTQTFDNIEASQQACIIHDKTEHDVTMKSPSTITSANVIPDLERFVPFSNKDFVSTITTGQNIVVCIQYKDQRGGDTCELIAKSLHKMLKKFQRKQCKFAIVCKGGKTFNWLQVTGNGGIIPSQIPCWNCTATANISIATLQSLVNAMCSFDFKWNRRKEEEIQRLNQTIKDVNHCLQALPDVTDFVLFNSVQHWPFQSVDSEKLSLKWKETYDHDKNKGKIFHIFGLPPICNHSRIKSYRNLQNEIMTIKC